MAQGGGVEELPQQPDHFRGRLEGPEVPGVEQVHIAAGQLSQVGQDGRGDLLLTLGLEKRTPEWITGMQAHVMKLDQELRDSGWTSPPPTSESCRTEAAHSPELPWSRT
ncbi:MAG: hypothetical protein QOF58_2065 [Pseudonocardiales bacterium]|jgi:hypothetical protein|nr:hypothetical protein [Pseudonocardiales bacterium]